MAKARIFGTITKAEENEDGTLTVSGIASTETRDSDGEVFTAECMKAAIPDYMRFGAVREMHQPIAAGTALAMETDEKGVTHLEALVVDPVTIKKVQTGVLKGFSIGGNVPPGGRDAKNRKIIHKLNLTEVSLVDRPANPDAVIELVKFEGGNDPEEPVDKTEDTAAKAEGQGETQDTVKKGLYGVSRFADLLESLGYQVSSAQSESEWEGDNSPVPARMREWLAEGAEILKAMAAEEVEELLASLKPKGSPDVVVMAEMAAKAEKAEKAEAPAGDVVEKKGAKFSKATKEAFSAFKKAHDEFMKALDMDADSDGDEAGDNDGDKDGKKEKADTPAGDDVVAKAAGLQDAVAKLEGEKADLVRKNADLEAELDRVNKGVQGIREQLEAKGVLRVVDKADDDAKAKKDNVKKSKEAGSVPATPLEAIRQVHAAGGTILNPRA